MKRVNIKNRLSNQGIEISIDGKKFEINYPASVWKNFPKELKENFADSAAYLSTWQYPLDRNTHVTYHFPLPLAESIFSKILLYSLPMNTYEHSNKKTSDVLRIFYNSAFNSSFEGKEQEISAPKPLNKLKNAALLLLSFGKDSLLTHALTKELKIQVESFFMYEPLNPMENKHKLNLIRQFEKDLKRKVTVFPLSFGELRRQYGYWFGWDIVLSQYIFFLIPYMFYFRAKYLFLGHEQSCNFTITDPEGFTINTVYEQSILGTKTLQNLPKLFSIGTHIGSLIEPIHEIFITWILHKRYPEIGKYQLSCFVENPKSSVKKWCGNCEKCALMYLYLSAFNIDPQRVGFGSVNMLKKNKARYFGIFDDQVVQSAYGGTGLGRDEQLLGFYLAYKSGVKGDLIDQFKKKHLNKFMSKKNKLINDYFGIHTSLTIPPELEKKVLKIFQNERGNVLRYIKSIGA